MGSKKLICTPNAIVILLLVNALFSISCIARQLHYERTPNTNATLYSYQWRDSSNKTQSLAFSLTKESTQQLPITQINYKPLLAQRYIQVNLLQEARKVDPKTAKISIKQSTSNLTINIESHDQAIIDKLHRQFAQKREETLTAYLDERYLMRYTSPLNQNMIKPDHIRYISENAKAFYPAANAIREQLENKTSVREFMNILISWIQTIPYDTLEDRNSSNGSGFAPPLHLLNSNQGDCDSKSVLTASVLRSFLPKMPISLILLNDHALLGIAIVPKPEDDIIEISGVPYVLLEPTGPALLTLGKVDKITKSKLQSGHYTTESVPFN